MDPWAGRFTAADIWQGVLFDAGSLHKYSYVKNNPVNLLDLSGFYTTLDGQEAERAVCDQWFLAHPFNLFECGKAQWVGRGVGGYSRSGFLKPDLFDFTALKFAEVKPFSPDGVYAGKIQIELYKKAFGLGLGSLWKVGGKGLMSPEEYWEPRPTLINGRWFYFFNSEGVIFYTDQDGLKEKAAGLNLSVLAPLARSALKSLGTRVSVGAIITAGANISARLAATSVSMMRSTVVVQRF